MLLVTLLLYPFNRPSCPINRLIFTFNGPMNTYWCLMCCFDRLLIIVRVLYTLKTGILIIATLLNTLYFGLLVLVTTLYTDKTGLMMIETAIFPL